jgi:hypothetical protein
MHLSDGVGFGVVHPGDDRTQHAEGPLRVMPVVVLKTHSGTVARLKPQESMFLVY